MTLCVLGGSFDPPHVAHVLLAAYALSMGYAERVLVIPVFHHAFEKPLSPFALRLEMCRQAFAHEPRVEVSDIEASLPEPSYTVKTLEALLRQRPGVSLRLLIGADVARETSSWHRFSEVERLAPPLVVGRVGVEGEGFPPPVLPRVSSQELRKWFKDAKDPDKSRRIEALIPPLVREVIEREQLYR